MRFDRIVFRALMAVGTVLAITSPARAQTINDWQVFPDPVTDALCDVVNASNAELIVLTDTGQMAVVSGTDVILSDLVVNQNNEVAFEGQPFGFLTYAEDREGLPALFWTTLTGSVVGIDTFTGEPFDSGQLPEDFPNTACDACNFVDSSPICDGTGGGDGDGGGGDVPFDGPLLPLLCGALSAPTMLATLGGLMGMRFVSPGRRRRRNTVTVR